MNKELKEARKNKKNEFYTLYSDIVAELSHYDFKDKIVYCNCDDGHASNFFKYFVLNFKKLGIKKVICSGFTLTAKENGIFYYDGGNYIIVKKGEADFRKNIDLLKECDVVVTNPPFSLFREYFDLLKKYNKQFLIIGNQNAVIYKEIFPLIRNNKVLFGYNSGNMVFKVPGYYEPKENRYWQDETGQKWRSMGNICWFTNLKIEKEFLSLTEHYYSEKYQKYDNYDAINVDRIKDIPCDYNGVIGVPITFINKYNSKQFEIIDYINPILNNKNLYKRILIKRREKTC